MGGGSSKINTDNLPVVVVVGGGYGGVMAARALDRRFFVVLIDRKDFFSHQVALPRAVVEPSMANQAFMPYTRMLTNGVAITATVTAITPTEVRISGLATALTFDYLIIALGSSYTLPARVGPSLRNNALTLYTTVRAAVERANSVLVVGAGAVGTELAAEVATDFPGKKVTLVNAHSYFGVAGLSPKWNAQVLSQLGRLHVAVMREQRVIIPDEVKEKLSQGDLLYLEEKRTFRTSTGEDVTADLTFFTTGTRLNSGALSSGPFASILSARGELPVNDQLQVRGYSSVFAIGDISGRESTKLARRAGDQAEYVGKHLPKIHEQRGDVTGVPAYVPGPHGLFVSLGRKGGAGEMGGSVFPIFIVKMVKSGDMLVGRFRGQLGLKKVPPDARRDLTPQEVQEKATRLAKAVKISESDAARLVKGELVEPTVRLPAGQDHL